MSWDARHYQSNYSYFDYDTTPFRLTLGTPNRPAIIKLCPVFRNGTKPIITCFYI